jgi:hypothetical protein
MVGSLFASALLTIAASVEPNWPTEADVVVEGHEPAHDQKGFGEQPRQARIAKMVEEERGDFAPAQCVRREVGRWARVAPSRRAHPTQDPAVNRERP